MADLFIGRVGVEAGIQLIYRYGFCFVFYVDFGGGGQLKPSNKAKFCLGHTTITNKAQYLGSYSFRQSCNSLCL